MRVTASRQAKFDLLWAVELSTGSVVSSLEFEQDVTEILDVRILPGICIPHWRRAEP